MEKYPKGALADDALYWQGWSFYQENDVSKALAEFEKFLQDYPQSPLLREVLYQLGTISVKAKRQQEGFDFLNNILCYILLFRQEALPSPSRGSFFHEFLQ